MSQKKGTYLWALFAFLASLLSTRLIIQNPPYLKLFSIFTTFVEPPDLVSITVESSHHLHRRHHRKRPVSNSTICDDFPLTFPRRTRTRLPTFVSTATAAATSRRCNRRSMRSLTLVQRGPSYGSTSEKVMILKTKPNITFQGQGMDLTAIAWNDTANSSHGTFYSASVTVYAANFVAKNISFINVAPIPNPGDFGAQAVAIRVAGDQAAFWGCGFFGAQDTLHDDGGRHYYKECFIQGSIDFIFGDARSLYEDCRLISIASPVPAGVRFINGVVTAHGRTSGDENTGFAFVKCSIGGTGQIWLGRAWRPYARVVFAYTSMSDIIAPEGWNDFNDPASDQSIFFGEYKCSGDGANLTMRVPYVQKLNDTQASPFLNISFIDGDQWLQPFGN
uniref:Pectinesterase n=1 Tax=Ananas comosus var. bracteatus TaxID=296719 RepID=A0A6V7PUM6_ANACO|nr:unnamed protein product [Ananas comosus var. bracteatus]